MFELKDKIDINIDLENMGDIQVSLNSYDEALAGLMTLGYSRFEVDKAIRKLDLNNMDVEDIIRQGLKKLSKN